MNKWEHRNNINVIKLTESKRLLVMLISWCYNQTPSTTKVYLSWFPQLTHRSSIVKDCPHLVQSLVYWREILFWFSQTVFFCFYSRVFWFSSMFMTGSNWLRRHCTAQFVSSIRIYNSAYKLGRIYRNMENCKNSHLFRPKCHVCVQWTLYSTNCLSLNPP